MKLEIDTINKTIVIESETPILEVLDFLNGKDLKEWKIKSKERVQIVEKETLTPWPYTPYNPDPLYPYITYC